MAEPLKLEIGINITTQYSSIYQLKHSRTLLEHSEKEVRKQVEAFIDELMDEVRRCGYLKKEMGDRAQELLAYQEQQEKQHG